MANEATKVEIYGSPPGTPIRYTVDDAAAIEKGTLMSLSGSGVRTGYANVIADSDFIGIANTEKVASDGSTTLGVWTTGIFDLTCGASGGIVRGAAVRLSGANTIQSGAGSAVGKIVGVALEAAATNGEVIQVKLGNSLC